MESSSDTLKEMCILHDKGLVTNYGEGGYQQEGGHVKFYPYEKGGAKKVLAMLTGVHNKFWGRFYTLALGFSHIEGGGRKKFPLFKRGR